MNRNTTNSEGEEPMSVYEHSRLVHMIDAQQAAGQTVLGLFTDVDHTYHKKGMPDEMDELGDYLRRRHIPRVAITGNNFAIMEKRIQDLDIPAFEAMACSVGTELWVRQEDGTYKKDMEYEAMLVEMGFVRSTLAAHAARMIEEFRTAHPEWQLDFQHPDLEASGVEQPDQKFKISFYFFATHDTVADVAESVQAHFKDQRIVICEEINYNSQLPKDATVRKFCLDILPVTKSEAVKYLTTKLGIKKGIVAGDSGNDTEMLRNAPDGFVAVLVGGAKPEALRDLNAFAPEVKPGQRNFRRVGEDRIVYVEASPDRVGPESILHAFEVLERASSRATE